MAARGPTGREGVKTVALYARVSSEKQAKQATVASQIAMLQERVQADGHVMLPSDVYVDEGYSGATLVRPALERLRDRAAEGGIDVLYVHNPDRLARRYAYQVLLLGELSQHGVSVVFLQGPVGRSAEDELLVQVQGMIAEYERAKIMERYRRGKLHKARSGAVSPLSGAPYGYLYIRRTDNEPARYQVLLHEAKVVRSIYSWLVEEQVSIGEIARRLRAQGVPTRTGKGHWDRSVVWAILRNPAYAGQAAYGKTESVERRQLLRPIRNKNVVPRRAKSTCRDKPPEEWVSIPVPPIVSADTFAAAHEQLERNRRLAARNARGQLYLLQGLVVCGCCGYAFYGKRVSPAAAKGKPRRYAYYRCVGSDAYRFDGGRVCHNPQVRVDQLDGFVWDSVRRILQDPRQVVEEWTRRGSEDGTIAEMRTQRDDTTRMVVNQEQVLRRLRDAYEAGAIELDDLVARSERVRARLVRAREELGQAEKQLAQTVEITGIVGRLTDFSAHVQAGLDRLDWQQRRQIIRTLVSRVEIGEEGATVVYRVPAITNPESGGAGPDRETDQHPDGQIIPLCGGSDIASVGEHPAARGARRVVRDGGEAAAERPSLHGPLCG
jgi:site-specific DNA recombinase